MAKDRSGFNREELNLLREWFNALQDATPQYLEEKDLRLYAKILDALDWPNPADLGRATERMRRNAPPRE